jgi:hypothetical protein
VGEAKIPGPPTDLDCEIFGTSDAETQREGEDGESRSPVDRSRTPPKQTDTRTVRGQGEAKEDGDTGNHLYYGENQKEKAERKERRRSRSPQAHAEKTEERGTQHTTRQFFRAADKMIAQGKTKSTHPPKAVFFPHPERIPTRSHSAEESPRKTANQERGSESNEEGHSGGQTGRKIPRMFPNGGDSEPKRGPTLEETPDHPGND